MKDVSITLVNESCFSFLKELESNSIDLALIDPPYEVSRETNFKSGEAKGKDTDRFRVSMDFGDWDSGFTGLDEVIKELYRVLRKGGTLICFYDIWKISILRRYFDSSNSVPQDEIIRFVKGECQTVSLTPQTLGMLFEMYADVKYDAHDPTSCFSREIPISELKNLHPGFESSNGCQWARSDGSYLGKKYKIKRPQKGGKVFAVRLDGPNVNSVKKHRGIRQDIRTEISKQRCVVLDVGSSIEVDHKNGKYDELSNIELENQKIDDFQPLSKAANDAKRQHCKDCIKTGKRYDARRLGYKEGWVVGDENTSPCIGCYWYDPKRFNQLISKDYKKEK